MADIALVFFPLDVGSVAALLPILMAPAQVVDDAIQVLALFQRLIAGLIKSLFGLVAADRIGFFQGNIFRQFCQQAGRFFLAAAQIPAALGQGLFLYRQFLLPFVMLAQLVVAMAGLFCQFGYGNLPFRQGLAALGGFGLAASQASCHCWTSAAGPVSISARAASLATSRACMSARSFSKASTRWSKSARAWRISARPFSS